MPPSMAAVSGAETIRTLVGALSLPTFTVDELADHTGVSRRTVDTIRRRYERFFERLPSKRHAGPGRPAVCWRIKPKKVDEIVTAIESRQSELQSALSDRWRVAVTEEPETELAEVSLIMAADALSRPAEDSQELGHLVAAARHSLVAAGFTPEGTPWSDNLDARLAAKASFIAAVADVLDASMANDNQQIRAAQDRALPRMADAAQHMPAAEWLSLARRILEVGREVSQPAGSQPDVRPGERETANEFAAVHQVLKGSEAWSLASIEKRDILFEDLEHEKLAILHEYFPQERRVRKGEFVPVEQGLSYIEDGKVSVDISVTGPQGKGRRRVRLADLMVGQFFGEAVLLAPGRQRSADIVAASDGKLRTLRSANNDDEHSQLDVFRKLIGEYPQLGINVCTELSRRLRRANRLVPTHSRGRVALLLLEAANEQDPTAAMPRLNQTTLKEIAEAAGLSRGAVGHALKEFESEAAVQRERRSVTILNRELLAREIALHC